MTKLSSMTFDKTVSLKPTPQVTEEQLQRLRAANDRDKLWADSHAVAVRVRKQLAAGDIVGPEEIEILVAGYLDAK